ncbi:MAG: TetR/AcrR family transcriptional regulator [Gammaproteobacteria bacterium]|nr:TetR/AcrR family transcriptional regulator [Gammaproteobacteria bacterium]
MTKKTMPRTTRYERGKETYLSIITAATDVFTTEGYGALSIRKVAAKAQISIGNLTYHFPNKQCLVEAMFEDLLEAYLVEFDGYLSDTEACPTKQLTSIVAYIFNDLASPRTTVVFPELWALANHEKYAALVVEQVYQKARSAFTKLIPQINPALSTQQIEDLALFMSASLEGHTMFVGANKQFTASIERLTAIAQASFIELIKNPPSDQ